MHAKDLYERLASGYNYDHMYGELCTERDRLKKENERLRELCSALYEFAYDEYPDSAELNFADRMRKLRIEVES